MKDNKVKDCEAEKDLIELADIATDKQLEDIKRLAKDKKCQKQKGKTE